MLSVINFIENVFEKKTKTIPQALKELDVPYDFNYVGHVWHENPALGYSNFRFTIPMKDFLKLSDDDKPTYAWGYYHGKDFYYKPEGSVMIELDSNVFPFTRITTHYPKVVYIFVNKPFSPRSYGIRNDYGILQKCSTTVSFTKKELLNLDPKYLL